MTHHFDTRTVHSGWEPEERTGAVMPPIYYTSTYVQDGPAEPRLGYEYSRTQNPTRFALEHAIRDLEGGARGMTFASGMAAIHTLLLAFDSGDLIVAGNDLYGGTYRLFSQVEQRRGLRFLFIDTSDPEALKQIPQDTKLLYLETPTNPLLRITSIEKAVAAGKRVGARVALDNTFATPALQRPIEGGVDVVIHSTTKYVCGHSDVVGGALVTADEGYGEELAFLQNSAGGVNGPMDAFLTLRGLRTLHLRMERHCRNAEHLADFLESHPAVERVIYPGLPSHPGHDVARSQMSAFGGMISFDLAGGLDASRRLVERVELFALAESLGGVESLIEIPPLMTHASIPGEERRAAGMADGLVRLSVGIEDPDDLRRDLERAFA